MLLLGGASQVALVIKNPPTQAGDLRPKRPKGSVPGWGRSPGGGHGNPLQYSCLENTHGQRSLVDYSHGFTKSQTRLSNKHTHTRCPSKHVCVCVCVCVCVYVSLFSPVQLFATPWTVAHQAPLSMGILQARILEWIAIPFSRGYSQPRD